MTGFPSTRRHPRTQHGPDGAFPRTAEYAAALECPPRSIVNFPWVPAIIFVAVVLGGLISLVPQ